jgi:hypothetical protein
LLQGFVRHNATIDYQLHALEPGPIVQFDESDSFGIPARAYPATQRYLASYREIESLFNGDVVLVHDLKYRIKREDVNSCVPARPVDKMRPAGLALS